ADDVDEVGAIGHLDGTGEFAQHGGGAGDLANGFLLYPQAGEDRRGHRRRHVAAHDLPHQIDHFVMEDLAVLDGALQGFLRGDGHCVAQLTRSSRAQRRRREVEGQPGCRLRLRRHAPTLRTNGDVQEKFYRSRKFFSNACPCSVRIDSGWNCTPSTGCSRWRRPMISSNEPSSLSVHAVTSRLSGKVSRATTSEWYRVAS